ncbi:hypothetical protein EMCRGX_G023500 [Ephydatia muelleri]
MRSTTSTTPRGAPEPFHLRTEERSTKSHHYCCVCANDEGELYMPKLSLPRLCGDCALVTTKLGETITRSMVGHVFDLTIPMGSSSPPEYNCLHDPHLRAFFTKRYMRNRLVSQGYITPSGEVLCTRREYNVYHHFLESEFGKVKQLREECKKMLRQGCDSKRQGEEGRRMIGHLTAERQALVLKEQRVCEVKETQHAAKMEAIRGRRDRKVLAALKLEADKRAQRCTSGVSSVLATVSMEKQKVKDKNEHSVQLATTKGRLVPEQKEVDEVENPLQQRERVAFLLKMYHEEKQRENGRHIRAMALKDEADQAQRRTLESKARKLNTWRVHFERLQKRWKTMAGSAVQPSEPDPTTDPPSTEPLSAKNSLVHHHTRMSLRDPTRKISVANSPKPTQCVRFNMEPKVHLFSKEAGRGRGDDNAGASFSSKGIVTEEECGVVRELEPMGVAL